MTEIRYITGDLLASDEAIQVHGCNAQGKMGSGFALSLRNMHPWAYDIYVKTYENTGLHLGTVIWAINENEKPIIGHAITQESYGRDGKLYVDYDAIRACIQEVDRFVRSIRRVGIDVPEVEPTVSQVGFPLIGAGYGGGKWSKIAKIIEEESQSFTPVVYLLDGVVPTD